MILTEETEKALEDVENLFENFLLKNTLTKSFIKNIQEEFYIVLQSTMANDIKWNLNYHIEHEVKNIMTNLLLGKLDQINNINLLSQYTFDSLHEIRLKIWETCSQQLENSIIKTQKEEIKQLMDRISRLEKYE